MRDREKYEKRVGTVVDGRWRVASLLGWGATSAVYGATHRNGHRSALKILHKHLCADTEVIERFLHEAGIANTIRHRAIVPINDDGVTEDGCAYLVVELLEGETLEERRAARGGRLALEDLAPIAEELMSALSAVHAAGVVHRDLKPQNVFLTTSGALKLLDFGTARVFGPVPLGPSSATGLVLGTPAFMAPEQARGARDDVDAQSDVWSLGASLFTLLSGEYVHVGRDAHARLLAAASAEPRRLGDVAASVDDRVARVVDRALARDKSERWPDVRSMRLAFREAVMAAAPTMRGLAAFASTADEAPAVVVEDPPVAREPSRDAGSTKAEDLFGDRPRESDALLGVVASRRLDPTPTRKGIHPLALVTGLGAMAAMIALVAFFWSGGDVSTGYAGSHDGEPGEVPHARPATTVAPAPSFLVIEAPDGPAAGAVAVAAKARPAWATAPAPKAAAADAGLVATASDAGVTPTIGRDDTAGAQAAISTTTSAALAPEPAASTTDPPAAAADAAESP